MNKRKRMIVKAKTQMIIKADTLEESGWYRRPMGKNGAVDKLIGLLMVRSYIFKFNKPCNRMSEVMY